MTEAHDPSAASMASCRTRRLRFAAVAVGMAAFGCSHADDGSTPGKAMETRMSMTAGGRRFAVTLVDSDAARAFVARLPMTLDMTDLNDNEKKFDLPKSLPANASRPGTVRTGDLMLWGDTTLVLFYKTFDSAYSYTRLGQVDDATGLTQALGSGGVRIRFSAAPVDSKAPHSMSIAASNASRRGSGPASPKKTSSDDF